jgi:hypothetical protein
MTGIKLVYFSSTLPAISFNLWGRRDRMVVGFITTYTISAYHH